MKRNETIIYEPLSIKIVELTMEKGYAASAKIKGNALDFIEDDGNEGW